MRASSSVSFRQTAQVVLQKLRTVILPWSSALVTFPTLRPTAGRVKAGAMSPISIGTGSVPLQPTTRTAAEQPRVIARNLFIVMLHSTLLFALILASHRRPRGGGHRSDFVGDGPPSLAGRAASLGRGRG